MQPISSGFGREQRRGQHGGYRSSLSSVLTKSLHLSGSHTHTHTVGLHTYTHTHTCTERFNMDKWALGRRIQLVCLSPPFSLQVSLPLGVSQDMPGLMPSNLLPNTHCRLSFKGRLTGMTSTSTPPALPLSSLRLSLPFPQLVRALSFSYLFIIPWVLPPRQNMPPTLPTMQSAIMI